MTTGINFHQTKDEMARRRQQKRGVSYQQTKAAIEIHADQRRRDIEFARSLGLNLDYEDVVTQNCRMHR